MSLFNPEIDFLPVRPLSRRAPDPSIALMGNRLEMALEAIDELLPAPPQQPSAKVIEHLSSLATNKCLTGGIPTEDNNTRITEWVLSQHDRLPKLHAAWLAMHAGIPPHAPRGPDLIAAALTLGQVGLATSLLLDIPSRSTRLSASQTGVLLSRWARSATDDNAMDLLLLMRNIFDRRQTDDGFLSQALDHAAVAGSLPALEAVLAAKYQLRKTIDDGLHKGPGENGLFHDGLLSSAFDEAYNACAPSVCERLLDFPAVAKRFERHAREYFKGMLRPVRDSSVIYFRQPDVNLKIASRVPVADYIQLLSLVARQPLATAYMSDKKDELLSGLNSDYAFDASIHQVCLELLTPSSSPASKRVPRL